MEGIVDWQNTKEALNNLMKLFSCSLCDGLLKDACSFRICQHIFCKSCALELVNETKPCPQCGTVLWREHLQDSLKIPEVVSICRKIQHLICKDEATMDGEKITSAECNANTYEFSLPNTEVIRQEQINLISDESEKESEKEEEDKGEEEVENVMEVDRELVHNAIGKQSLENLEVQDDNGNDTESNVHKPLAFVNNNQSTATRLSTDSTDTKNVETTLGTPPSISSQFSNVLTKSETRKGVQKNPRRMLKKPKVTYGRRKQQQSANLVVEKKALKQLTLPVVVQPKRKNVDDENGEYAVFDFCSGDCGKEQTVETPTTAAAMSLSSDQQADENKLISPRLNVRRSRSKRRRINMAASKKSKRSVDTAVPAVSSDESTFVDQPRSTKQQALNVKPLTKVKKSQLEKRNKKGETSLHTTCIKGNVQRVEELLKQGAEPNTKDFAGWTPLHEASSHGYTEIVEILLKHGAIIDTVAGDDLDTPLHDAVSNNRIEVVKALLAKNAPMNIRNRLGLLPVDYATTDEMRCLLQDGISQSNVDNDARFDESSPDQQKVFVTTNIKKEEKTNVLKCCRLLGGKCLNEFDDTVTHVICGVDDENLSISRTMKYWHGLLCGKWLVSYQWFVDSQQKKQWVREADYEVKGTLDSHNGVPRKARINRMKMLPKLFEGCSFYLSGEFDMALSKDVVTNLIKLGGGKILSREPKTSDVDPMVTPLSPAVSKLKLVPTSISPVVVFHATENSAQACCTQYIIYDEKKTPAYTRMFSPVLSASTVAWLLDCISNFEILDIKEKHEKSFDISQS